MQEGKNITVKEGNREQILLVCPTDTKDEQDYLIEAEIEKTKNYLKKKPPKEKSKLSKSDQAGMIKEFIEFKERNKTGTGNNKKYW